MNRPWLDLHPKIAAALVTFVALIGVVWLARVALDVDLADGFGDWLLGVLPVLAGYFKSE
jgi:hypothetical protein